MFAVNYKRIRPFELADDATVPQQDTSLDGIFYRQMFIHLTNDGSSVRLQESTSKSMTVGELYTCKQTFHEKLNEPLQRIRRHNLKAQQ